MIDLNNLKINVLIMFTVTFSFLSPEFNTGFKTQLHLENPLNNRQNARFNLNSKVENIFYYECRFVNNGKMGFHTEKMKNELRFKIIKSYLSYIDIKGKFSFMRNKRNFKGMAFGCFKISHYHNMTRKLDFPYDTKILVKKY